MFVKEAAMFQQLNRIVNLPNMERSLRILERREERVDLEITKFQNLISEFENLETTNSQKKKELESHPDVELGRKATKSKCSICLSNLNDVRHIVRLPCNHKF